MPHLTEYSKRFRDMRLEKANRNRKALESSRMENFRLELDIVHILPQIKGPDVLDFPIGTGRFYPNLLGRFNVYGYDISTPYIEAARAAHPEIANQFQICSFEEPIRDRTFDTIVTLRTFRNLSDHRLAIRNAASLLKASGRWIFNHRPRDLSLGQFRALLEQNGFTVISEIAYDYHSSLGQMRPIENALYRRYYDAVEKGHMPLPVMRIVEALGRRRGTRLYVCERR